MAQEETMTGYRKPTSYAASTDPDIMYMHEALKSPDAPDFVKAMMKEIDAHVNNKNWQVIKRSEIPSDSKVLPAVWAMCRKRDIATRQVVKWKARLNVHGGKQTYGVDY
jgi:hypothetical protein